MGRMMRRARAAGAACLLAGALALLAACQPGATSPPATPTAAAAAGPVTCDCGAKADRPVPTAKAP